LEIEKMMKLADPQKWKKLLNAPVSALKLDWKTKPPLDKLTTTPVVPTPTTKSNPQVLFKDMEFAKPTLQPPKVVKPKSLMEGDDDFVDLPMNEQTGVDLNSASQKYGY
jgi:hypothetical protein